MRQDVYGVAYDEAKSELLDITCEFERLKARKARLEGVVTAMAAMLGTGVPNFNSNQQKIETTRASAPLTSAPPDSQEAPEPSSYTFNQVSVPLPDAVETDGDPFKRRVRNALRMNSGSHEQRGLPTAV